MLDEGVKAVVGSFFRILIADILLEVKISSFGSWLLCNVGMPKSGFLSLDWKYFG